VQLLELQQTASPAFERGVDLLGGQREARGNRLDAFPQRALQLLDRNRREL